MYFICICCFSSVSILFQNYPFITVIFSKHTIRASKPSTFYWRRSGETYMNFQISTDFGEMKRLCTFLMPFLYDWDFIFLFVLIMKFGARHRWKVILWFNWTPTAHFLNVNFNSGSGQTEAGWRFSPCLLPPWLWLHGDWKMTDFT